QAHPNFENDLRSRLIKETLEEIQYGRINDRGFEKLVASILRGLGAEDEPVIKPRQLDKGADIIAHFRIANTFPFTLAVQAKHYQPGKPIGKGVVETLRDGMEEENADLGWVATSGTFSPEAQDFANRLCEEGIKVELLDGEDLAALIVENGLKAHLFSGNLT
ncbi:MAG: restriction endonuclease, partial [Planctomycetes bacterium]|nr:restriction endonuclease [Planctomycetota bacterium]